MSELQTTSGPGTGAVARALTFIKNPDPDAFGSVLAEVFAFQFERNPPFRRFCRTRGLTTGHVERWQDVPPLPTAAFKVVDLTTAPVQQRFVTSGTGSGAGQAGRHLIPDLGLYESSWRLPFRDHVLPDRDRIQIVSLIPSRATLPESSLSYMVDGVLKHFGDPASRTYLNSSGIDFKSLAEIFDRSRREGVPVCILATAFAMVEILDRFAETGQTFVLPAGSRIMDTGGTKGRSREASRDELMDQYQAVLGIPRSHVVGEYGMTELCSQFYESPVGSAGESRTGLFEGPPWTRTRALDPETLAPVSPGTPGLLAHWDLANAWTVCAILTEDLGVMEGERFRLLGRAEGAELRGCSLATEELLHDV